MTTSTALHTDRYELTMLDAAMRHGTADRLCLFEAFGRRLPGARRYGIIAGTGRLLDLIRSFRFRDEELAWLRDNEIVSPTTLDWLANYRFSGSIWGYAEGEVYFPNSPVLVVEAPFAEGVILETLILSVLNYDTAVANAASRMVTAALGRPLAEMGSRRAHEEAAVAAARAAFISGFSATSNLEAGRRWGLPTMGTAAHAFTLLHGNEEEAFRAQVEALGTNTTLLIDTYDVTDGVRAAIAAAGTELGAVRLDSGDLPTLVMQVRAQLDSLGATTTKITVTSDLDEYSIAALAASPVDSYGVGTALVTGSGSPAAGLVYKLVARQDASGEWAPVAKHSDGKASVGGRKQAVRRLNGRGVALEEVLTIENGRANARGVVLHDAGGAPVSGRPLLTPLVIGGDVDETFTGVEGTRRAREHRANALAELPQEAFRLTRGEPVIPTVYRS